MPPRPTPVPVATPAGATAVGGSARPSYRLGSRRTWFTIVLALVLMVLVRGFLVQSFFVPSGSMEPTLSPGDRILVMKVAPGSVHRGDVVVFDGTWVFAHRVANPTSAGVLSRAAISLESALSMPTDESDYVKRVIGVPGDRVRCCDPSRRLQVNGTAVQEPYVMSGNAPSDQPFDVVVPAGHLWVMGDHRSDSADSRAHLHEPGGGMVALDDVIGRPILVYWPLQHAGRPTRGSVLAGLPRAGTR